MQVLHATLPYVRQDVPVIAVFRALGFEDDRSILEHIVYDFDDTEMMEIPPPPPLMVHTSASPIRNKKFLPPKKFSPNSGLLWRHSQSALQIVRSSCPNSKKVTLLLLLL